MISYAYSYGRFKPNKITYMVAHEPDRSVFINCKFLDLFYCCSEEPVEHSVNNDIIILVLKFVTITGYHLRLITNKLLYSAVINGTEIIDMFLGIFERCIYFTEMNWILLWDYCLLNLCKRGKLDVFKLYMNKINMTSVDFFNKYLMGACMSGYMEFVMFILDHCKATYGPNLPTVLMTSGLHGACKGGQLDIAKFMLNNGGSICKTDETDDTSDVVRKYGFPYACRLGHIGIVKLIMYGVKKEDLDNGLQEACHSGNTEIAELLIENGAVINWNLVITLVTAHTSWSFPDIIKLAVQHGATNLNEGLISSCFFNKLSSAQQLIKSGATNIDQCLYYACEKKYIHMVVLFSKYGATNFNQCLLYVVNVWKYENENLINIIASNATDSLWCLESTKFLKPYYQYCKFKGLNTKCDSKYLTLLQLYPLYILLVGSKARSVSKKFIAINRLPVELFRLLNKY